MTTLTLSADQLSLLLSALSAVSTTSSSGKMTKSKAPKKRSAGQEACLAAQMAVFEEMRAAYFSSNPSAVGLSKEEIKKRVKNGSLPPLPTYVQALKEHSRRKGEADPEHKKKAEARRKLLDEKQGKKKTQEPEDEEAFNETLLHEGTVYLKNKKNWVITKDQEWVGIWDPVSQEIDTDAEPPSE